MPWAWQADQGPRSALGVPRGALQASRLHSQPALRWSSADGPSLRSFLSLGLRVHLVLIQVASGSPQR